jgi:hypothetical protein
MWLALIHEHPAEPGRSCELIETGGKARANENWALSGTPKTLLLAQHITTRVFD